MTIDGSIAARLLAAGVVFLLSVGATHANPGSDVFRGKLFPPNLVLENRQEIELSRDQFTSIREAVVEVQASVAEHEWDMREVYLRIPEELDAETTDEERVIAIANEALLAENEIEKQQMAMLIRVRNILNDDQLAYLRSLESE